MTSSNIVDLDANPTIPTGFIVSHSKRGIIDLSLTKVEPYLSRSQRLGRVIPGKKWLEEIRSEHARLANANLCDYYFAHQDVIPAEFARHGWIFFPGTVYGKIGVRFVRYLREFNGKWSQNIFMLHHDFHPFCPAASFVP